jgi:2-dehydropantoate 2-reductase
LAANSMANPVAGLSGLGTGELRTNPTSRRISIQVAAEVVQVARAAGYEVEPINGIDAQRYVDGARGQGLSTLEDELIEGARFSTGAGRPSLLQDVIRGRRTEIEDFNGLVVAEGKRLGVQTPFNEAIVREVTRHGVGTLTPDFKNLEPIAALLPQGQAIPAS